jgi:hypothetical protein
VGDMPPLTSNRAASSFSGLSGGRPGGLPYGLLGDPKQLSIAGKS